jgi:hypothetical protein
MGWHTGPPEASAGRQHAHKRVPPWLGELALCRQLRHRTLAFWVVAARQHIKDPAREVAVQEV